MDRPEYPVVWGTLAEILKAEYKVTPEKAFKTARRLVTTCRQYGLDIVRSDWVYEPQAPRRRDPWAKAIEWLADMQETGREPWYPDGEH